jgi:hypothetical protein
MKYVVVKDGTVFWGKKENGFWLITYTNVRDWATKLSFKLALQAARFNKEAKIIPIEDFEEYKLNGEV